MSSFADITGGIGDLAIWLMFVLNIPFRLQPDRQDQPSRLTEATALK